MNKRGCSILSISLLFSAIAACSTFATPPSRGYLDAQYPVNSMNGKRIYILGLSRMNAKMEGMVSKEGAGEADSYTSDSLLIRFNGTLLKKLTEHLGKATIKLEAGLPIEGTRLHKWYGDTTVPDSIRMMVPSEAFFKKREFPADISLLIGTTVFGKRSILVKKWAMARPNAFGHQGGGMIMIPEAYPPDLESFQDDGEIDTSRTKTKRKVFYSFTEFCFFDHRTGKAFGYGIDVVETKFNGEFVGFLTGNKVDPGGHVSKMAKSLAGLFLRSDSELAKKYSAKEVEPVKQVYEKDDTKEILEQEED